MKDARGDMESLSLIPDSLHLFHSRIKIPKGLHHMTVTCLKSSTTTGSLCLVQNAQNFLVKLLDSLRV